MPADANALILDIAREQQRALAQHANELDTKAAALLGFAGLLLGLLFSSEFVLAHWTPLLTVGTVLLVGSLIPLGAMLIARDLRANPNVDRLIAAHQEEPNVAIDALATQSLQRAIRTGSSSVWLKSWLVRCGALLIAVAVALISVRLLVVLTPSSASSTR